MVYAASHSATPDSQIALATLCQNYWPPLYAYVRHQGHQAAEAQDLTQAFFLELLAKDRLAWADESRGRFRAFLLGALKHFLANEWRARAAIKRGGGTVPLSLDFARAESQFAAEPVDDLSPERLFERRWATALIERSINRLADEQAAAGKTESFQRLRDYLIGAVPDEGQANLAQEIGTTPGALKVAIHRLRKRCRELLREEIAQTVATPEEVDDELRSLFRAFE
jgi:RNA polymerase sigma-70 factor (ECF subfamily)